MDYTQTLDYLYTRLPMFSRIGDAALKKDLGNTLALCSLLGNPQHKFKSIHVAGTNGKGSTSHMLAAVLQKAGYKTGLYTSPHLYDFRERIRINGRPIPEAAVVAFTQHIAPHIPKIEPSFFEMTVAMAFDYFSREQVDVAVIEVGLGGRLDSTNIIQPEVSVITHIGMDHMSILGNSLESIAAEKAGIIKANTPVVLGSIAESLLPVFENKAALLHAPVHLASREYWVSQWQLEPRLLHVQVADLHTDERIDYTCDLPGFYQTLNIPIVLSTLSLLRKAGWAISPEAIKAGLANTRKLTGLHGRWEQVADHPALVLDVAHNEDGIRQLVAQLELSNYHELHLVMGMVKDKAIESVLELLPQEAHYYFTQAQIPRALPAAELAAAAAKTGKSGGVYRDVATAVLAARQRAGKDDLILVCGSVFLVAEFNR